MTRPQTLTDALRRLEPGMSWPVRGRAYWADALREADGSFTVFSGRLPALGHVFFRAGLDLDGAVVRMVEITGSALRVGKP